MSNGLIHVLRQDSCFGLNKRINTICIMLGYNTNKIYIVAYDTNNDPLVALRTNPRNIFSLLKDHSHIICDAQHENSTVVQILNNALVKLDKGEIMKLCFNKILFEMRRMS